MKINYVLLPLKAHYFFFHAAMAAIFPFLPVYGKQLGVSPLIMGSITAILPIVYMITKPTIGFIMDYFQTQKKLIFMFILVVSYGSCILIYFLPPLPGPMIPDHQFENVSCAILSFCDINFNSTALLCDTKNTKCHWTCRDTKFSVRLSFYATSSENEAVISPNTTCLLNFNETALCQGTENCNVTCDNFENDYCLYTSTTFWGFVFLMSLGTIGIVTSFNINNAICFEVLGKGEQMKYGKQRIWGEISYGLVGFLVGYIIDIWSQGKIYKTYTPAFLFAFIFISIDLLCCKNLKLPRISRSANICANIYALSKYKSIIIFFCFAVIVGAIDGYIIFFLLWYEEDLAIKTGYMDKIKLIEGLTVAAEAFGCVIFLPLSGRILNKFGYGYTFNLSLVFYVLRLGLISIVPTPWWIVLIEFLLLGLSYTLSYVTTIAFADVISSSSVSVSVQGIMSGLKEGFGFAIGNLVGSMLLKKFGGALTLQIFSIFAAFCALVYFALYITYLKHKLPGTRNNVEWKKSDDARKRFVVAE
ncbi:PREDICTED: major facilitator superfamily domain-containing protein 6-like [Trachymyrmex cornetzi]|uniref:major facilitator superfamily domain-containing protein 6-like n=1 Tax=Trachymyrmex cornetzi TaxID=471704 RepID=UPI00084F6E7A|nr:PREDICTED: major facilitator superfamily domain-containing protein 6-like [Trachymyrmex cornetzi]